MLPGKKGTDKKKEEKSMPSRILRSARDKLPLRRSAEEAGEHVGSASSETGASNTAAAESATSGAGASETPTGEPSASAAGAAEAGHIESLRKRLSRTSLREKREHRKAGSSGSRNSSHESNRDKGKRKWPPTPSWIGSSENPARQFNYYQMMMINGPHFDKTSATTSVDESTTSLKYSLPQGLNIRLPADLGVAPSSQLDNKTVKRLSHMLVAAVPDHNSRLHNEGDVIRATIPFFSNVLEVLTPAILHSHGLHGPTEWRSEHTFNEAKGGSKRPDVVFKYKGKPMVMFDYKGPNCIRPHELEHTRAANPQEVAMKLKQHIKSKTKFTDDDKKEEARSLFALSAVQSSQCNLVKQAVNYGQEAPFVAFYDYTTLLLIRVSKGGEGNKVFDSYICGEEPTTKSQSGHPHAHEDNHVAVMLKWILTAVQAHEAKEF